MTGKRSLADLLRNHINEQLKQSFDYSTAFNRKADIEKFIENNKQFLDKKTSNPKSIRPSHSRALDECLKNKGIDPSSLGRKSHKPKFNSDLNAVITPETQTGKNDSTPPPKTAGTAPVQQGGVVVAPVPETFDQKAVSASINSFYLMLRAVYPDLELLTEEEKDSLGNLWHTAFNKYFTDKYAELLIPFVATFGMLAPKILEARKKKKNSKEIVKKIPDHIQEQADIIKKEALEKEKKENEKVIDKSATQQEQKIQQAIDENENMPKNQFALGEIKDKIE